MIRITELAQQQIAQVLREGDVAVDATAGNGLDTLFWPAWSARAGMFMHSIFNRPHFRKRQPF